MNEINKKYLNDEKLVQPEKDSENVFQGIKIMSKDLLSQEDLDNIERDVQSKIESANFKQSRGPWRFLKLLGCAALALAGVALIASAFMGGPLVLSILAAGAGVGSMYYGVKQAYSAPEIVINLSDIRSGKDQTKSHDIAQDPKLNVEKAQNEDKDQQVLETKSNWVERTNKISDPGQSYTNKIASGNSQDGVNGLNTR